MRKTLLAADRLRKQASGIFRINLMMVDLTKLPFYHK